MIKEDNLVALLQNKNVLEEGYFDVLKSISVEDIKNLTNEELAKISLTSIVDYLDTNDLLTKTEYQQWFKELCAKLRKPNFDRGLVFKGMKGDKRYFATGWQFYLFEGLLYNYYYNDTAIIPSPEQIKQLNDCFRAFIADYHKAKQGIEGFLCAKIIDKQIYFRRLPNFKYQFISIGKNNFAWQDVCTIDLFLENCPFWKDKNTENRKIPDKVIEWVKSGSFPLMLTSDKYMRYECKYICGCASQKASDYLTKIDNKPRYVPQKKDYGLNDINIINAKKIFTKYALGPIGLSLETVIDGKLYSVTWTKHTKTLSIYTHWICPKVNITDELFDYLSEILKNE